MYIYIVAGCFLIPVLGLVLTCLVINILFFKKSYSNKEAINIGFELKERSFACKNLEVVNIRCSKDDERVHMLAEIFVANGLPIEKIYVRRTGSTCE
jgi:hypothetical protein